MIGTRGVPAQYGGFETAVEEIGYRLVDRGMKVSVYCRNRGQTLKRYRGMSLVNLPAIRHSALETLSHSGLSVAHSVLRLRPDAAVLFNAANSPYINILKVARIPTAVHVDGIEWKRAKWAGLGSAYYRWAERKAARTSVAMIADAQAIADYLYLKYGRRSYVIPYGAPILYPASDRIKDVGLASGEYHLVVARLEPENNVELIVEGYRRAASGLPLVVVGSAAYGAEYVQRLHEVASGTDTRFLGAVWDQELLNQLYGHCRSYLHGHSVGGTNPSLLRALGSGAPTTAFDVDFNREVATSHARYFKTADQLAAILVDDEARPAAARRRGASGRDHASATYRWDDVADRYAEMLQNLADGLKLG